MSDLEQVLAEQRTLRRLVEALLHKEGMLQWVDRWAFGENEGGQFVSLYNSRLGFRICNVYHEQFTWLPKFIQDALPTTKATEISTERQRMDEKGRLHECPRFQIIRYKLGEDERDKWRFGGVNRLSNPATAPAKAPVAATPQAQTQPRPAANGAANGNAPVPLPGKLAQPDLSTRKAAISWALEAGAFASEEEASRALAEHMQRYPEAERKARWIEFVRDRVKERQRV